jgi:alpha-amylase
MAHDSTDWGVCNLTSLICWARFLDAAGNKITVPAPPTNPGAPWLFDFLTSQASALSPYFNAWQLPPVSKAQGGSGAGADGYEVNDLRDIGSKNQQGSIPTRYGSRESLLRAIATAHANGIEVQLDISMHQIGGDSNGFLEYFGSDGKTKNGRGAITPGELRGNTSWNPVTKAFNDPIPPFSPEDAVPVPFYDYPFGRERVFQNCQPPRKSIDDCVDFGSWLLRSTGARGPHRFDDVKGTWAPFVAEWMNSGEMKSQQFFSEFFDNAANAAAWALNSPMKGRSGVEDFDAHFAIADACNNGNAWALNRGPRPHRPLRLGDGVDFFRSPPFLFYGLVGFEVAHRGDSDVDLLALSQEGGYCRLGEGAGHPDILSRAVNSRAA